MLVSVEVNPARGSRTEADRSAVDGPARGAANSGPTSMVALGRVILSDDEQCLKRDLLAESFLRLLKFPCLHERYHGTTMRRIPILLLSYEFRIQSSMSNVALK